MLPIQQRHSHLRIGGHSPSRISCHSHLRGGKCLAAQRCSNGTHLAKGKQEIRQYSVGLVCVLAGLIGFVLPSSAAEDIAASFQKNCAGKNWQFVEIWANQDIFSSAVLTHVLESVQQFHSCVSRQATCWTSKQIDRYIDARSDSSSWSPLETWQLLTSHLHLSLPNMPVPVLFVTFCRYYRSLKHFCSDVQSCLWMQASIKTKDLLCYLAATQMLCQWLDDQSFRHSLSFCLIFKIYIASTSNQQYYSAW